MGGFVCIQSHPSGQEMSCLPTMVGDTGWQSSTPSRARSNARPIFTDLEASLDVRGSPLGATSLRLTPVMERLRNGNPTFQDYWNERVRTLLPGAARNLLHDAVRFWQPVDSRGGAIPDWTLCYSNCSYSPDCAATRVMWLGYRMDLDPGASLRPCLP